MRRAVVGDLGAQTCSWLYAVDANGRRFEDLAASEEYAKERGQFVPIPDKWEERYMAAFRVEDQAKAERTLAEHPATDSPPAGGSTATCGSST